MEMPPMKMHKAIPTTLMFGAIIFSSLNAAATEAAKTIFDGLYKANTTACTVCHISTTGKPLTIYGVAYVAKGGDKNGTISALVAIEDEDPDLDTISNILEIRTGTDPIAATVLEGTVATSTEASGDVLVMGTNVGTVSISPVTDVYAELGLTLDAGQEILSNVKLSFFLGAADPVTITYAKAIAMGAVQVHEVTGNGVTKAIAATVSETGSVTFTPSSTNLTIVIEHTKEVISTASASSGASGGCIGSTVSMPLMLMLGMLFLGIFFRKKP